MHASFLSHFVLESETALYFNSFFQLLYFLLFALWHVLCLTGFTHWMYAVPVCTVMKFVGSRSFCLNWCWTIMCAQDEEKKKVNFMWKNKEIWWMGALAIA